MLYFLFWRTPIHTDVVIGAFSVFNFTIYFLPGEEAVPPWFTAPLCFTVDCLVRPCPPCGVLEASGSLY